MNFKGLSLFLAFTIYISPSYGAANQVLELSSREERSVQKCLARRESLQNRINQLQVMQSMACEESPNRCKRTNRKLKRLERKKSQLSRQGACRKACTSGSLLKLPLLNRSSETPTELLQSLEENAKFCERSPNRPSQPSASASADINGDGCVGTDDVSAALSAFGKCSKRGACVGDIDGNKKIDAKDIGHILKDVGQGCQDSYNKAPLALSASYSVAQRGVLEVSLAGLASDSDQGPQALRFSLVKEPENGTATLSKVGGLRYEPTRSFVGNDVLEYRVYDGVAYSATATIAIEVEAEDLEPLSLTPCSGLESQHIYPVSTAALGQACPDEDSKIVYVSSSTGSDTNSGLSPDQALASVEVGLTKVREGSPDWLLLRRGDTFTKDGGYGGGAKSGLSVERPAVISAFGDALLERPKLMIDATVFNTWNKSFLTWSGIHIETTPTLGGTGLRILAYTQLKGNIDVFPSSPALVEDTASMGLVVEDVYIRGYQVNIIMQAIDGTIAWNQFVPAQYPMVNLESERVIRENGIYYLLCSAVQNNPNSGNFIASEAAICNRNSNVANDGSHILCHQDGAEDCDKSISVMVKIQDPVIRDSVLVDAAPKSTQGGHSQGVFASGVFNLRILNNVIDNNGWYADRNGDEEGSRRSTIFNHNLYLQHGSGPSVIKGNISARASSHGLQARAGAVLEENVFMRNPLSFFVADGGYGDLANATSYVIDNVVLEGNDINDDTPRGFGGEHNTARQSEFRDNIFAHLVPEVSEHNNLALKVGCDQNADILCSGYFEGNIVFGWEASNGRGTALEIGDDGVGLHADDQLIFVNNSFHLRGSHSASKLISLRNGALFNNPRYTFIGGSYSSPDLAGGASADLFKDTAQTVSTADWQDEGASLSDTNSFPDTCRTAASYYYKNALDGDDSEACTIMHDNELFEAFMQMARQRKQRFTPAGPFTTAQFLEYVRAGFGK